MQVKGDALTPPERSDPQGAAGCGIIVPDAPPSLSCEGLGSVLPAGTGSKNATAVERETRAGPSGLCTKRKRPPRMGWGRRGKPLPGKGNRVSMAKEREKVGAMRGEEEESEGDETPSCPEGKRKREEESNKGKGKDKDTEMDIEMVLGKIEEGIKRKDIQDEDLQRMLEEELKKELRKELVREMEGGKSLEEALEVMVEREKERCSGGREQTQTVRAPAAPPPEEEESEDEEDTGMEKDRIENRKRLGRWDEIDQAFFGFHKDGTTVWLIQLGRAVDDLDDDRQNKSLTPREVTVRLPRHIGRIRDLLSKGKGIFEEMRKVFAKECGRKMEGYESEQEEEESEWMKEKKTWNKEREIWKKEKEEWRKEKETLMKEKEELERTETLGMKQIECYRKERETLRRENKEFLDNREKGKIEREKEKKEMEKMKDKMREMEKELLELRERDKSRTEEKERGRIEERREEEEMEVEVEIGGRREPEARGVPPARVAPAAPLPQRRRGTARGGDRVPREDFPVLPGPPLPQRGSAEAPPAPPPVSGGWEIAGRRKKQRGASTAAFRPPESAQQIPAPQQVGGGGAGGKRRGPRPPRTAAVSLWCPPGASYSEVLRGAKGVLKVEEFLGPSDTTRRAANGGLLLQFPGKDGPARADRLADELRRVVPPEVRVGRPTKMADLRVTSLDDSVTQEEVLNRMAAVGGCSVEEIRAAPIRRGPRGTGSMWARAPLTAAIKVAAARLRVGWSNAGVELLKARPLQCFRCLGFGHVAAHCPDPAPREEWAPPRLCYRCGQPGHVARVCTGAVRCLACVRAGLTANHRMGGALCPLPRERAVGQTGPRPQVDPG